MQKIVIAAMIVLFIIGAGMWGFPDTKTPDDKVSDGQAVQESVTSDSQDANSRSDSEQIDGLAVQAPIRSDGTIAASQKPTLASPRDIALMYARYAGEAPDFQTWALEEDEYKNASAFDKGKVQTQLAQNMLETFQLLTSGQPFSVDLPVMLGEYNADLKGYLVDSIKEDTFLPFSYMGKNYAVIIRRIADFQWLPVDDLAQAKAIDDVRLKSTDGKSAVITFTLIPQKAERQTPLKFDNKEYWMLATRPANIAIYDDVGMLLWQQTVNDDNNSETRQKIINLYK